MGLQEIRDYVGLHYLRVSRIACPDRGKGIYLTITHPQIAMAIASGGLLGAAIMPIPTAVV